MKPAATWSFVTMYPDVSDQTAPGTKPVRVSWRLPWRYAQPAVYSGTPGDAVAEKYSVPVQP